MSVKPVKLELAEGVKELNKCYCYKDDNGVVTVTAAIEKAEFFGCSEVVAKLPEGYRPDDWVELPATFGVSPHGARFAGTSSLDWKGDLYVIFDKTVKPKWAYIQFSFLT